MVILPSSDGLEGMAATALSVEAERLTSPAPVVMFMFPPVAVRVELPVLLTPVAPKRVIELPCTAELLTVTEPEVAPDFSERELPVVTVEF